MKTTALSSAAKVAAARSSGRCGVVHWCFSILFLAAFAACGQEWPSVHLERSVTVTRGQTTDVNPNITGLDENQLTYCVVRQVPQTAHLSCGALQPQSVDCDAAPESLIYKHYGCKTTRDLLHLQLLATRNGSQHYVQFYSVEVIVEDYRGRLMSLETSIRPSAGYTYTQFKPIFPTQWVGKCYYRITRSLLPTAEIQGPVNYSPLPCGYVPKNSSFYLINISPHNRSILIEVTGTAPEMPDELRVLMFANTSVPVRPQVLSRSSLVVLQSSHTPVPPAVLPCSHPSRQCIFVLPVLETGAFVPAYSPRYPHSSITKFTSEDVAAGIVMFVPNTSHFNPHQSTVNVAYNYTVLDYSNHMLAQGSVSVTVYGVNWSYPSLRFVSTPLVQSGGSVSVDSNDMQFYFEPEGPCSAQNTYISISQSPRHGSWYFAPGSRGNSSRSGGGGAEEEMEAIQIGEAFPYCYLKNGSLVYQHRGDEGYVADSTVWNISCQANSFELGTTVLIMYDNWTPFAKVDPCVLIIFCGRLSPVLADVPLYSNHKLHFDLNASHGTVVRLDGAPNMLKTMLLPPYLSSGSYFAGNSVTQVSIEELQRGLVWYIPSCPPSSSLNLTLSLPNQQNQVNFLLLYSTAPLEDFLMLSTDRDYLRIVKNQPLPISSAKTAVYITSAFLYTTYGNNESPDLVVYRVLEPPRYGKLCPAFLEPHLCNQSLTEFTQSQLDRYKIVYRLTSSNFPDFMQNNDTVTLELLYQGVSQARRKIFVFRLFAVDESESVPLLDTQLWVNGGKKVTIPLKLFKPLRPLTFQFLVLPQFGRLVLRNRSLQTVQSSHLYTFGDIESGRLQYRHRNPVQSCRDTFTFSASNSTHNLTQTIVIAIRQRREEKLGVWEGSKSVFRGQDNFVLTSEDFNFLSDFCLEFLKLTVDTEPSHGVLRLFLPKLRTFVQVRDGDGFDAEDVENGRLWYMLIPHNGSSVSPRNDGMKFTLSDPENFGNGSKPRAIFDYQLMFLQPEKLQIQVLIETRDVYVLSWIPELEWYGYVFQPGNIQVRSNPDLSQRNISIKILVKDVPRKGLIKREQQTVRVGRTGGEGK